MKEIRLGVNIDHVATLRNARGGTHPDPIRAAKIAEVAGADGITVHLREDRRHIRDEDVKNIIKETIIPVNLELAGNQQMIEIACALEPNAVCIVPENRQEVTTVGTFRREIEKKKNKGFFICGSKSSGNRGGCEYRSRYC